MVSKKALLIFFFVFSVNMYAYADRIEFESKHLGYIISKTLSIEAGLITQEDMKRLVELRCVRPLGIHSLNGIEHAINLEVLIITNNDISDISPIKDLNKLKYIDFAFNKISEIEPLRNLKNVSTLNLKNNYIKNIVPIENFQKIELLLLYNNPLNEDSYLVSLPKIIKNNPKAKIWHNKSLHPEKALFFARQIFRYILFLMCGMVILILITRYLKCRKKTI